MKEVVILEHDPYEVDYEDADTGEITREIRCGCCVDFRYEYGHYKETK